MKPILIAIALLALASCVGAPAPVPGQPVPAPAADLSGLAAFTVADLQAASADAKAQVPPDQEAYQCYDYLITVVPTVKPGGQPATVGAFLIFQKARDLEHGIRGGVSSAGTKLNLACAPLVNSVNFTIARLGVIGAGVAATGGAVAPLLPLVP